MAAVTFTYLLTLLLATSKAQDCKYCVEKTLPFSIENPLPVEDLIKQFGYAVESHTIKTDDGYLLKYHRIPRGKATPADAPLGKPVVVQHGLLGASSSWILSEQSLAYTLSDAGFDVWLANSRGNTYSRNHTTLDPDKDKDKFWDFSWHENGLYDVTAGIDYILEQRGEKKLIYVGHSMGTTMFLVMADRKPEYMAKIEACILMAPVAYPWNVRTFLADFFEKAVEAFYVVVQATDTYEILPHTDLLLWLDQNFCSKPDLEFVCRQFLEYVGGFENGLKRVDISTVLKYNPAGASYKQLLHYTQIADNDHRFEQFDFGLIKNLLKYRSIFPPAYSLSKATAPIYVYYAPNDYLAVPEDVNHAVSELPNVKKVIKVEDDVFNHFDFMWALDGKRLVYDSIVAILQAL